MVWRIDGEQCDEQDKIAHLIIPYTRGRCLDLGCGKRIAWHGMIGVDNGKTFGNLTAPGVLKADINDLSLFSDASVDGVFSSHAIEDFPEEQVGSLLKEWTRVLKVGGYLTLYVPSANLYPKVGEKGANPAHKWDIYPGDIERHLKAATDCGWTQLEKEERNGFNEYSLYLVFQKRDDGQFVEKIWERNPGGKKRCLVVRYGAIGDILVASSIFPGLKKQGWHITVNTTPQSYEILKHDPHVDEWLLQDKDQVPNMQLGPYWQSLAERYDQTVNLCESVEGGLLALPGRLNHSYSKAAKDRLLNKNYLEFTHDIAAVPHDYAPKFYPSQEEKRWAYRERNQIRGPVVAWSINGSSIHKVYPWTQIVVGWLLQRTDAHVFLLSDESGKVLEDGIVDSLKESGVDISRVHPMSGKWTIRQTLSFIRLVDCLIGPETGTLNAMSFEPVKKVIYLSHSSHENLTRDWKQTTVLEPEAAKCPCFPCHMMQYTWDHCHQDETTKTALCASSVAPERIFRAIALTLGAQKAA